MSTEPDDCKSPGFVALNARVDPDPLKELMRRRQLWASVPGADGFALKPDTHAVPLATIDAVIEELLTWRLAAGQKEARDLAEQFYDL